MTVNITVKNISSGPYAARTATGLRSLAPGESYTGAFEDGEAANIAGNPTVFETDYVASMREIPTPEISRPGPGQGDVKLSTADTERVARIMTALSDAARKMGITDAGQLPKAVDALIAENDAMAKQLRDIAALFDDDREGEAGWLVAVVREMQDELAEATKTPAQQPAPASQPMTLAKAVATLDDKNKDHWTAAGLPSIDALKVLTGGEVTRAEVDALVPPRVRKA